MFTPRTFSRKTLRIFSISFDKEWQPNIVEVAKGQKNLPAGFPVEKFLEQYRLWKQAMKSSDPEEKNSMTYLYADLREMHQAAGLNKWTGSVFASNEEMEIFGEFLEWLKGTRITNLPGAVFTRWSGVPVMANRPQTATVPRSPLDIRYDSEYGEFYRRSRDYANGKYTLPTEGAYVQEPRQWDKAIVIWNKDQNLIHSIIIDGDQYIWQNGAFRNKEGKTVVVTHDPASKRIWVSFSQPIMATPVPVAPAPARPAVWSPVMAQPVPSPLPPPIYTPGGRAAPVAAPLEDRDEKSFQEAMKGVSFTINGKEAKVLQIGHGAEGLRVQLQVGGTAMQQIQQTIVFKKENSTYRVSGNILDSYTVQDQVTWGKRTISLTAKSPTSDRVPAPGPAVPVAPAPAPRPTAPASDTPRPTAPARVERTAEQVLAWNKKFIVDNQKDIDGALSKVKDATLKSQLEWYLKDPTNENVRKFQDAIGYKPDGDFRDFTLAALIKWASNIPVATPEVAKPFPEIKVGQTLDEYLDSVGKAWHNGNPSLGKKLQDGTYSYQPDLKSKVTLYLTFEDGESTKKIIKVENRQMPVSPLKEWADVSAAIALLIDLWYVQDQSGRSTDASGIETVIYKKSGEPTYTIKHKAAKIVSIDQKREVPQKKEITTADLEAWKDKLGDGIKWSNTGTEKDPKKIWEVEVKGFMNLIYSGSERSYTVIKDTLYVWEDESSTWMKSWLLEIRDGKIEKILPKIESIEERVKKMKKVTLTGLWDAYKDIVPEYDADKKAIFLKAPHIETPQWHIRNYFWISEELFLAGWMVETGTIAFVKGLYNVTITPIDGELIVKMKEVKPAPRTKLVDLTIAEQAAEATRLFQEYLDATEHNQVKLSTRIKRPDTALRWVDTKDNDFAVGIDIATGKSFAWTNRKWDKELTQFEQGLWDTIITFMNRAAKMKKQVPDTSDPYESIRKKLQDQLTAPAPAPTPAPAPASAPSVAAPASSAASVPARSPSPKPTAPAASGVRRDWDATNY